MLCACYSKRLLLAHWKWSLATCFIPYGMVWTSLHLVLRILHLLYLHCHYFFYLNKVYTFLNTAMALVTASRKGTPLLFAGDKIHVSCLPFPRNVALQSFMLNLEIGLFVCFSNVASNRTFHESLKPKGRWPFLVDLYFPPLGQCILSSLLFCTESVRPEWKLSISLYTRLTSPDIRQ